MATVEQDIGQTLEEQNLEFYCDCIERKQNEVLKTKPRLKQITWYRLGQRKDLGWDKVHQELQKTPFCQRCQRLVKVMFCLDHKNCCIDGLCFPCIRKNSIIHYVSSDIDEYNTPRRCIEICDEDLEHTWIFCKLMGLDPTREIFQKFY